jgi:hypothetical protein
MARFWMLVAAVLALAAPAYAQQQRDPFNGQFGVVELGGRPD